MLTYFDNNASTPLDPRVRDAMLPYLSGLAGNPSSLHRNGRRARSAIDVAREQVAALVKAYPSQVIFTSGGSEANNMVLKGLVHAGFIDEIWMSSVEHDSVRNTAFTLASHLRKVQIIPVDIHGSLEFNFLQNLTASSRPLVSTQWVNNENGVIQNIFDVNQIIKQHQKAFHHVDAVQAVGKISIDFYSSGIDFLTVSSHKIFGPQGVGALIAREPQRLLPLICGGGQEDGLRSGTENVAGIVGFGMAAELANLELLERQTKNLQLRTQLEYALARIPGTVIFGQTVPRAANTSLFAMSGITGEMLLMELDRRGFCVSSGSACQARAGKPSHILEAMKVPETLAECVIRVSLSHFNDGDEIDNFIATLQDILRSN